MFINELKIIFLFAIVLVEDGNLAEMQKKVIDYAKWYVYYGSFGQAERNEDEELHAEHLYLGVLDKLRQVIKIRLSL